MRKFATVLALLFLASGVLAGEIPLELRTGDDADMPFSAQCSKIRYASAERPDGAKVPPGELEWGRLTVGESAYAACIARVEGKAPKFYLDLDGDGDLAEEEPFGVADPEDPVGIFELSGVPGKFKVEGGEIEIKLKLHLFPEFSAEAGILPVFTAYTGKLKADGIDLNVVWVPGEKPCFNPPTKSLAAVSAPEIFNGETRLSLRDEVVLKDGKVVAVSASEKREGLQALDAPPGLACVCLVAQESPTVHLPSSGKVFLPPGNFRFHLLAFSKELDGTVFELMVPGGPVAVTAETKLASPEPLALSLEARTSGRQVRFSPALKDAAGREVTLVKDGKDPLNPALTIADPEGVPIARHVFVPG